VSRIVMPESIVSKFAEIERRLAAIERSPQLGNSSIAAGGLTIKNGGVVAVDGGSLDVKDASGIVRVRVGKDGSDYDVKVFDAAGTNAVALSTLAYGIDAQTVATQETTDSLSYTDLSTVGPTVTVTIGPSGRALVWTSVVSQASANNASGARAGYASFALSGATTQAASDTNAASLLAATGDPDGGAVTVGATIGVVRVLTGLTPGSTTFTMKYKSSATGFFPNFSYRTIAVQPF
jgi:hypothetical protein